MTGPFQRDALFERLFERAKADPEIVLVVADMAAPALDRWRRELPHQIINTGIAEQNCIQIASGLAREGFKAFAYAIASFITLRCFEQIRVSNGVMGIPLTVLGMGTGLSYCTDGPTHHLIEDVALFRSLPNANIFCLTDAPMAAAAIDHVLAHPGLNYLRIDKDLSAAISPTPIPFDQGYSVLREGSDLTVAVSAPMVETVLRLVDGGAFGPGRVRVVDVFRHPLDPSLAALLAGGRAVLTVEEHFTRGGLGTAVLELMADAGLHTPVRRLGLSMAHRYKGSYVYGGREETRRAYGLDPSVIEHEIHALLSTHP